MQKTSVMLFSFTAFLIVWSFKVTVSSKSSSPTVENVVASVGQSTSLNCSSWSVRNIVSTWQFVPVVEFTNSTSDIQIWSKDFGVGQNFSSIFYARNSGDSMVELHINDTQLINAGSYICRIITTDNGSSILKLTAQLIVIDGNLTCDTESGDFSVKEFDSVQIQCIIRYRGNWAPVMEWRLKSEDGAVLNRGIETQTHSNRNVTSVLNILANSTLHNAVIVCKSYFTSYAGRVNTTATNIPNYRDTWTSPPLNVSYGPKNVQITPRKKSFSMGDTLTCTADANPEASFEWGNAKSGMTIRTGATLYVTSSMLFSTVECTAFNPFNSSSTTIEINGKGESMHYLAISLAVLCFLLILLILLLTGKELKGRCLKFCTKRRAVEEVTNLERDEATVVDQTSTDYLLSQTETLTPGMTLPQRPKTESMKTKPDDVPVYAAVDTKSKKKRKNTAPLVDRGIAAEEKLCYTYIGDDGTEYLKMHPAVEEEEPSAKVTQAVAPPIRKTGAYEISIYADIDHTLKVPPLKMTQKTTK